MDNTATIKNHSVQRLTALWALSESGLGGVLHGLKVPFSGFFLAGFSTIIITLIAYHSPKKWASIIHATILVILVKALASPHSPPTAYVAVAFQGFMGAMLLTVIPNIRLAAILFGAIALTESAIQKILITTLIFGESIWQALDLFFKTILKDLRLHSQQSFSFLLISTYVLAYLIWGVLVGNWAVNLCRQIEAKAKIILPQFQELNYTTAATSTRQKSKQKRLLGLITTLVLILLVLHYSGLRSKIGYVILRTVLVTIILFFIVNPILKWIIQRWTKRQEKDRAVALKSILDLLPKMESHVRPAYELSKQHRKGWRIYPEFVENLIILSLYNE